MSWLLAFLGIMLLIVLHELGHFTAAKAVGMRVERFSLFFPPKLFGIKRGETEYMIGALPFGGYVKITGMSPEEIGELDPEVARRAYYNQAPWKRIVVILAGPAVNLLIAFLIFWVILLSGSVNGAITLTDLNPSISTISPAASVGRVVKSSPALGVLRAGDHIVAVEGRAASVESVRAAVEAHSCAGKPTANCVARAPVHLTVRRDGQLRSLAIYPRYNTEAKRMLVGVEFAPQAKQLGVVAAAGVAVREMWKTTTSLVTNISRAFTSAKVRHQLHSVVGISEIAHESVVAGAGFALIFMGFISLVLAIMNLFPFLPLDGGHILWAVAEKVRGRRISLAAMYRYSSVGIILLAFLVINGVSNDISHIAG